MPTDKKKVKQAAKRSAKAKRIGGKMVKSAHRLAKKSERTMQKARAGQTYNRKKQVKATTQAATAENLYQAGKKAVASGKRPVSKKGLKVTPRSAHKKATATDKYYTGRSKAGRKTRKR